ncbi:hypothetical protein RMATCC62417_10180 [Rhizopus microsporus]|nr:hypothetical protein RMATCC62417_10180 [Rhizopus microsporus]
MYRKQDDSLHSSILRVTKSNYYDRDSGIATTETEDESAAPTCIFSDDDDYYKRANTSNISYAMDKDSSISSLLHSPNYFANLGDQAIYSLKDFMNDHDWKKVLKHKSGVTVYMLQKQHKGEKSALFRGETVIEGFTPQSIFYVIGMRKLWDEQFEEGRLIENLNDTTSLTYESYKSTSSSKAYDVTLVEKIDCSADGEIIFACTSVDTPKAPKVPGKNRHHVKLQGWILRQTSSYPPATKVTFITQEYIRGWIPGLTKKSLARKPLIIAAIDDYLQRKANRLKTQGHNSQKQISEPSIPRTVTPPSSSSTPKSILSLSTPSPPNQPIYMQSSPTLGIATPPLTKDYPKGRIILSNPPPRVSSLSSNTPKQVKFADDPVLKPTASNPYLPKPSEPHPVRLYPASRHREARKESLESLKRHVESNLDEWKSAGESEHAKYYIKPLPDTALPIMRSDCEIQGDWSPEQVCSVIQCFGARKKWDEHFEDGQVVERFSQKEYLIHIKMKSLFPIQSRDFSVLTSIESNINTGAVYIVSTSVEDELLPLEEKEQQRTRGHYTTYGWALLPSRNSVKVTFIAHMHLGGTTPLPSSIVRRLTTQIPSCLDRIQNYLNQVGCPPYIRRVAGKIVLEQFDTESKSYSITYMAKHAPSRRNHSSWCTDLRVHPRMYALGYHVETQPLDGVRVEIRPGVGLRVYTENEALEGERIHLTVVPVSEGTEPRYTWNSSDIMGSKGIEKVVIEEEEEKEQTEVRIEKQVDVEHSDESHVDIMEPLQTKKANVDEEAPIVVKRRHSADIVITDELAFSMEQFSFIILLMLACYYLGKLSCQCSV